MKAVRVHSYGGPEVLGLDEVEEPGVPAGHLELAVAAAGVNFIDVYNRTGLYPRELPFTPGIEAAGEVVAVGEGVEGFGVGDRVASAEVQGAYAEVALVPAEKAVPVPTGVETGQAAALMVQGMTAHYLCHDAFPLATGDTCLVHAAAGGVGLLLVQMAKRRGARVIGTVSTEAKARLARDAGADHVVLYVERDFEQEVEGLTDGRGLQVVFDSVGQATFEKSLRCLAPRGMLVLFGQSSGLVPPISPSRLASGGSLFLTRPMLFDYVPDHASLARRAGEVFSWVAEGRLRLRIEHRFPLAAVADAHRALEGRRTTGKVLLEPAHP
jgi:NADPH2:quinone reductase